MRATPASGPQFTLALGLLLGLASTPALRAHESETELPFQREHVHEFLKLHAHTGWESRYASEGRDSLDGDSLWASTIELSWDHFTGGLWFGESPDRDYDELQLTLAFIQSVGPCELYLAYTHLRFPFEGSHDHEISLGLGYDDLPLDLQFSADLYYSLEAEGYFAEAALRREISLADHWSLNLSGALGINQGYLTDGHDGANHLALRLGTKYALTDSFSLTAHTAFNWALNRDATLTGDSLLTDFFHGGLGVQWSF